MYRAYVDASTPHDRATIYLYREGLFGRHAMVFENNDWQWVQVPEATESPCTLTISIDLADALYKALGVALRNPDETQFMHELIDYLREDHKLANIRTDRLIGLVEKLSTGEDEGVEYPDGSAPVEQLRRLRGDEG